MVRSFVSIVIEYIPSAFGIWGIPIEDNLPLYEQREPRLLFLVKALAMGLFYHIRPHWHNPEKKKTYDGANDEIGDCVEEWILKQEADVLEKLRDYYKNNKYIFENKEHGQILADFTPSYYRVQEKNIMGELFKICMNTVLFLRWAMDEGYENALPPMVKTWLREQEISNRRVNWQSPLTVGGVTKEEEKAYINAIEQEASTGNKKKLTAVLLSAKGMSNAEIGKELPLEGEQNVSRYKQEGKGLAIGKGLPPIWGRGDGVPPPDYFLRLSKI
jgi:hypothetical protein